MGLVDLPATTKILLSKCITLCHTTSVIMFNQNITIQKHLQATSAKN